MNTAALTSYLAAIAAAVVAGVGRLLWGQRRAGREQAAQQENLMKLLDTRGPGITELEAASQLAADALRKFEDSHPGSRSGDVLTELNQRRQAASTALERLADARADLLRQVEGAVSLRDVAQNPKLRRLLLGERGDQN